MNMHRISGLKFIQNGCRVRRGRPLQEAGAMDERDARIALWLPWMFAPLPGLEALLALYPP
jgi:hypothetical protein